MADIFFFIIMALLLVTVIINAIQSILFNKFFKLSADLKEALLLTLKEMNTNWTPKPGAPTISHELGEKLDAVLKTTTKIEHEFPGHIPTVAEVNPAVYDVVEEPVIETIIEEPAVYDVVEEPVVETVVEEPVVETVVEEPVVEAVVEEPVVETVVEEPVSEVVDKPIYGPVPDNGVLEDLPVIIPISVETEFIPDDTIHIDEFIRRYGRTEIEEFLKLTETKNND